MADTTQMRKAEASFSSSSGTVSDSGQLSAQLNDFARAGATIFPGDTSGLAKLPLKEMAAIFGQAQQRSLAQSAGKFTGSIVSNDGEVSFAGFEVAPECAAGVGHFAPRVLASHHTATLMRLHFSLYICATADLADITTLDIPKRVQQIVRRLVEYWRTKFFPGQDAKYQATSRVIHEQNTEPLQILDRILGDSDELEMDSLERLAQEIEPVHHRINSWIVEKLNSGAGDFWSNFLSLLEDFGLIYAPAFGGVEDNGRLVNLKAAFDSAQTRTDVAGLSFTQSMQLPEVPVSYVMVTRVPASGPLRAYAENIDLIPGQIIQNSVSYPPGKSDGRAHVVSMPPFLSGVFMNLGRQTDFGRTLQPGQSRDAMTQLTTMVQSQTDALRAFLTQYAKQVLHLVQLQGSTASLSCALDLSFEVGTAYEIGVSGDVLFRGLLASVQHSVSSNDRGPDATTRLSFSHVQWGGFRLSFA